MPASAKTVDMTNVKERSFNTKHLPEGDYRARVKSVADHTSKKGNFQWLFTIEITEGTGKGASYPYYCGVGPDELWKVRNLMVACGVPVPKKRQKLDPNKAVNRKVGITLEDDEYEGKPKSVISAVMPISEVGDASEDADEDDEEVEEDETEEDEDEASDPIDDMDRAELKAAITALDSSFKAKKSQSDDDLREVLRGLSNASDTDDDEEDEEDEEPPAKPAKKKKSKKTEVTDDELEELEVEDL